MAGDRAFLFLQGPIGPFFRRAGRALTRRGYRVIKVNFNGGDLYNWHRSNTVTYHGQRKNWPAWLMQLIEREGITDILLTGEWRPLHVEAMDIARHLGLRIFIFEEGYLRPDYITMEEGGVNGCSLLPKTPEAIRELAATLPEPVEPIHLGSHARALRFHHIIYYLMAFLFLWPLFPCYRSHRPYSPWRESFLGWLPRLLTGRWRQKQDEAALAALNASGRPYFLFPLQLDSDAQVRRYSPFSGMREGISHILTSFAHCAAPDTALLIKNHPLDPGLINFRTYIQSYARALKVADRVYYVESGGEELITRSQGLVLLNSTIGIRALKLGRPVFYLGQSICAVPGLGNAPAWKSLNDFWRHPLPPEPSLLADFEKILKNTVLVNGNLYNSQGSRTALPEIVERLLKPRE